MDIDIIFEDKEGKKLSKRTLAISKENFTLLYASGPLMDFMSDLQELSPEKNLEHRLQVLNFLIEKNF